MNHNFFPVDHIAFEGTDSNNSLAFRHYDKDAIILGKSMQEHLRFSCAYWHCLAWEGGDPFGGRSFDRPWYPQNTLDNARIKADIAFQLFSILGVPYYCFHDADIRPEGNNFAENTANLNMMVDILHKKQAKYGIKLLWGTANLFSHRRYMAGSATNPDPDVFAFSAATIKTCLEATQRLGGKNYVLWGGREGYETLLNTDLKREDAQMGRMLNLVVEHKYKIGFNGQILIEPKPQEPTKHQYDYDVATCYGFLKRHGLENEVKINIEQGHAILAGHSFEHEIALAISLGIFASIDMNRNDYQSGWDTDQFPNNHSEIILVYYHILKNGGFTTGGTNFDAKLRRQSIDAHDLLYGHIGAMDVCARGLKAAVAMLEDDSLEKFIRQRYADWNKPYAQKMLNGDYDLEQIAAYVAQGNVNPQPRSGRQEYLENFVNQFF